MSNIIGVRNNNTIVPYQAATKRTKWITVTAATDIVLTGTGITTSSIGNAKIMAYADSNGVWFVKGEMRVNRATGGPGARTTATITFTGNYPFTFSGDQAAATFASSSGIACTAQAISGTATIIIYHTSSDEAGYHLNFDCCVSAQPSWAAANMEGVTAVDVYIPPASATEAGIITTGAQTFAGVKTFTNGISLGNETLSVYDEGTWSPSIIEAVNISGTPVFVGPTYTRIGNTVFVRLDGITGCSITNAGLQTYFTVTSTGLPLVTNNTIYFGNAFVRVSAAGPYEMLPVAIADASAGSTDWFMSIGNTTGLGVTNGDSLNIISIFFSYKI